MKRKVIMEGELGELFGKERTIFADSFADVFKCLHANFGENFEKYIIDCHEKDLGFILNIEGGTAVEHEQELFLAHAPGTMTITPAPVGSSGLVRGLFKIIAAVVIAAVVITATMATGGTALATFVTALKGGAGILAMVAAYGAVALALSGLMDLLAPDPSVDGSQQEESYVFQGAEQNIVEGDPVPVCYGKLRVPGRPIGFDLRNKSQAFINYNRRATTPVGIDSSGNYIDYGNFAGTRTNAAGADIRAYIRNLEAPNQGYLGGGRTVDNNPNTVLR